MNDFVIGVTDTLVEIILSLAILFVIGAAIYAGFTVPEVKDRLIIIGILFGGLAVTCLMFSFWCVLSGIYKRLEK